MTEQVVALARGMCGPGQDEELLCLVCAGACRTLDR